MRNKLATALSGAVLIACAAACSAATDSGSGTETASTVTVAETATTVTAAETTPTTGSATADGSPSTVDPPESTPDSPTMALPTRPNRDDTNVDARDFEVPDSGRFVFVSPSGNVYCAIDLNQQEWSGDVGCQAIDSVPGSTGTVCDNSGNSSYAVKSWQGEVTQFCTNRGIYVGGPEVTPVLEYGEVLGVRGTFCRSDEIGISCWASTDGFLISRDINTVLN